MDPDQMFKPSVSGPPPQPVAAPNMVPAPPVVPEKKSKLLLWIIIGGTALLLIILVAVIVLAGGSKKPARKATTANTSKTSLEPASALDIQQVNDSISNHLNQVNDDRTLPATSLSDKTLGL